MNRFDLNTEELIHLLMDKETSADDRSLIKKELQKRPESSGLLQEYTHLQNIFNKVKSPVSLPPQDWTNSILEQVKSISEHHFGFSLFRKFKYALLGLILLIPFGLYLALNNPDNPSNIKTNPTIGTSLNSNNGEIFNQESKLLTEDKNVANETISIAKLENQSNNSRMLETTSTSNSINITQETTINIDQETTNFIEKSVDNYDYSSLQQNNITLSNLPLLNLTEIVSQYLPSKINFSRTPSSTFNIMLQSRGSYAITKPEKNFTENDFFGNTYNLGVYVDVYESVYAGAEFGSEVFSQIFIGSDQPGVIYDQTPTLFYFGLTGRYEFDKLSVGIVKPVGHLFVGGSSLGPLVRANVVIQANVLNPVGIFVGLEGGLLYYKNQNIWYNSSKLGIVGGINFKF